MQVWFKIDQDQNSSSCYTLRYQLQPVRKRVFFALVEVTRAKNKLFRTGRSLAENRAKNLILLKGLPLTKSVIYKHAVTKINF